MKKEMLINVLQAEECRIAIIEDGVLEELYIERTSHETYTGNIYKGRIVNLEPAIQAAFVDFSIGRNGFLHVSDIEPRYYRRILGDHSELGGRDRGREPRRTVRSEGRPESGRESGRSNPRPLREPRRSNTQAAIGYSEYSDTPPQGYSGSQDIRFGEGLTELQTTDSDDSSLESSTQSGRSDQRRDRSRRGSSRNRSPRYRDRGPRVNEPPLHEAHATDSLSSHPEIQSFESDFEDAVSQEISSSLDLAPELTSDPTDSTALESIGIPSDITQASVEVDVIVEESVYEVPSQIPPPQPSRPRRSFGAGLEDWDNEPVATTSSFFKPIVPDVPVIPEPVSPSPADTLIISDQPEASNSPVNETTTSVTHSVAAAPQKNSSTRKPKRPRFGSGLFEDAEPDLEELVQEESQEQIPIPTELTESETVSSVKLPESPIPTAYKVQTFDSQESVFIENRSPATSVDSSAPAPEASLTPTPPFDVDEPSFEMENLITKTDQEISIHPQTIATSGTVDQPSEGLDPSLESEEPPAPRSRSRRRTGSDRGRGRGGRRTTSEISTEAPEADLAESGTLDQTTAEQPAVIEPSAETSLSSPVIHPGREAIRARGGDRQPIGPRPAISEDLLKSALTAARPAQTSQEKGNRGSSGRYVPRLERERRRSRSPRVKDRQEGDLENSGIHASQDFESTEGLDESLLMTQDFEAVSDVDPRISERGPNKTRRRRRRRRPGLREKSSGLSEPRDLTDLESGSAEGELPMESTGSDWSELDWSGSPSGTAEAMAAEAEASESAESDSDREPSGYSSRGPRQRRGHRRHRRNRTWPEIGPAPEEDHSEELEDDFNEAGSDSYVLDPNDIVEPELEEEIRREAEEIEALEIELGIREPGEFRDSPRSGGVPSGRSTGGRGPFKPPIQEVFQRNDEVLVQVIKESLGTKGPTLSTYISIPGRYLVLMPGLNRVGVSRKIGDEGQRRKLRDQMNQLNPPKGLGFIVRTAGVDRSKRDLARDLAYLLRLWKTILRRIKRTKSPAPIYQESDMIIRTIRDIFNAEIDTIWIDEPSAFERAQEFLRNVMPKFVDRLKLYSDRTPLFHRYGIEEEIAKIGQRHVPLPDGGSIVIDQTEALVAIDVNSGSFRADDDAERNAYEMNLRAAREIARQLRLRDLGGVIVNDFIDMRDERHRRGVERALRDAIRRDRARTKILRMSQFGLIEMTRQRIRPSIKRSIYEDCPNCLAQGVVKTAESMSIDIMRILAMAANRQDIRRINIICSQNVANFLNNRKRQDLSRMERDGHLTIHIRPEQDAPAEFLQIDGFGNYNTEIRLYPTQAMLSQRRMPNTTSNAPSLPYSPSGQHQGGPQGYHR